MRRKLAVILASDVAGYSRLVAADEETTIARFAKLKQAMGELVAGYHGRIFNTAGDAVLAEFASAVDAVRCAIEIQDSARARNLAYRPEQHMLLRIGIAIGDVLVQQEDGDLLGDGVNVAARLQTLAQPGGVCVSEEVYQHVARNISFSVADLGPQELKNLPHPIRVFEIVLPTPGQADRSPVPPASPAPTKAQAPVPVAASPLPPTGLPGVRPEERYVPPARSGGRALAFALLGLALIAAGGAWWWLRPAPPDIIATTPPPANAPAKPAPETAKPATPAPVRPVETVKRSEVPKPVEKPSEPVKVAEPAKPVEAEAKPPVEQPIVPPPSRPQRPRTADFSNLGEGAKPRALSTLDMPFLQDSARKTVAGIYGGQPQHKAIALSRDGLGNWNMRWGHASAEEASAEALRQCEQAANSPCDLFALNDDVVWPAGTIPMPPTEALTPRERHGPFAVDDLPASASEQAAGLRRALAQGQVNSAVAMNETGRLTWYTGQASEQEAVRRALERCGYLSRASCQLVAVGGERVVEWPSSRPVTGVDANASVISDAAEARRYLAARDWKAVAVDAAGKAHAATDQINEAAAVAAAMAACEAAGKGCRLALIGPFTVATR